MILSTTLQKRIKESYRNLEKDAMLRKIFIKCKIISVLQIKGIIKVIFSNKTCFHLNDFNLRISFNRAILGFFSGKVERHS